MARAQRGRLPVALAAARVLVEGLFIYFLVMRNWRFGWFDPVRYRDEITTNTDFCKHDETVSFVIDCPTDRIEAIRDYLERRSAAGELRYGMHQSDTALMTCLVTSLETSLHVHFIDGGDGGYTSAAKNLKGLSISPAE